MRRTLARGCSLRKHEVDQATANAQYDIRRGNETYINAWWSLIRASILVVLYAQRQNARRGIDKYKVTTVARPPLHITNDCVLQRFRARVAEEAIRVPEQHVLMDGILFAGVLGHVHDEHIVLSAALGGACGEHLRS